MAYMRFPNASVETLTKRAVESVANIKLLAYNDDHKKVKVTFGTGGVEITNSYLVSKADRLEICELLTENDISGKRSAESYAAEWVLHNDLYYGFDNLITSVGILKWDIDVSWLEGKRKQAQDANLDFSGDDRGEVRFLTGIYYIIRRK